MGYGVGHGLMLELAWLPEMTGQETETGGCSQPWRELQLAPVPIARQSLAPHTLMGCLSQLACKQLLRGIC